MNTYILLSKLTPDGRKTIRKNPERVREVDKELEKYGVRVLEQYATLGPYDFVNIVEAPDNETIGEVSVDLCSRGTLELMTLVAIPVDKLITSLRDSRNRSESFKSSGKNRVNSNHD